MVEKANGVERDFTKVYVGKAKEGETHEAHLAKYARAVEASLRNQGRVTLLARGFSCLTALEVGIKSRPQGGDFKISGGVEEVTIPAEKSNTGKERVITTPVISVELVA